MRGGDRSGGGRSGLCSRGFGDILHFGAEGCLGGTLRDSWRLELALGVE